MEFKDATSAWKGINRYMVKEEKTVIEKGGAIYGPELISYNNFIRIKNMKVDPDFDFGFVLSYKDKKWSALVNNYVNFNYLDLIKSEIAIREKKGARSYNYALQFANHHGGGKDCLIAMNFTKRVNIDVPVVVFEVRVSEVTHRLIFDFLLVQRIIEYVYGTEKQVEAHFIAPSMFITAERIMAFNNVVKLKKLLKEAIKTKQVGRFQKQILTKYKKYSTVDPMSIQFRSFRRAAQSLQIDEKTGRPVSGAKPLLAKDLQLMKFEDNYPDDVVTPKQRVKFNKEKRKTTGEETARKKRKKKRSK